MSRTAALALLAVVVIAGCGGASDNGRSPHLHFSVRGWRTDFSRHSVPLSEFASGGPPRDGIPPIDHPRPVSEAAGNRFLSGREPVIAVTVGAAARAYPIQILVWHEIVNDVLDRRPIAVSYCPLCNSAVVFDRRVGGRTLSFGTTGNLRHSDLVMWDRQTQSWWQQLTANSVVGKLTGTRLSVLPSEVLSWSQFKARYPSGGVLSRNTGFERSYGDNPYVGYDRPQSEPGFLDRIADRRLPPKERVCAATVGRDTVVVPFSRLARHPAVEESVGGRPVAFLYARGVASALDRQSIADSKDAGTAAAFDRRVGARTLDFVASGAVFRDRQTGSAWDITGRAVAGPLRGSQLTPVQHDEQFWFALAAFLPKARIAR